MNQQDIWDEFAQYYDKGVTTVSFYQELLQKTIASFKDCNIVLDAGCGTGTLTIELAKQGKQVYAVDNSEPMLSEIRGKISSLLHNSIFLSKQDMSNLNFESDLFDGVACINLLPCITNPIQVLNEIYRVLKKDGIITISGPRPKPDMDLLFNQAKKDWITQGVYEKYKKYIEFTFEINKKLAASGIQNFYTSGQLKDILLNEIGFRKITHLDDNTYLGQAYFVIAKK